MTPPTYPPHPPGSPATWSHWRHISSGGWQCVTDSKAADEEGTAEMEMIDGRADVSVSSVAVTPQGLTMGLL